MISTTTIDHLVYGVHDLEAATDWFEQLSGVRPVFGGYHRQQGTMNALVGLGAECYLELVAVDPDNGRAQPPRWMGIDLLGEPKLMRWAAKSVDLSTEAKLLRKYEPILGQLLEGQRQTTQGDTLRWGMSLPAADPEVEAMPFLLDWSQSAMHPAEQLGADCTLLNLMVTHPKPERIGGLLPWTVEKVTFAQGPIRLSALLDTPNGKIRI